MRFEAEVWEKYSEAQNCAKRVERKTKTGDEENSLLCLASVLDQKNIAAEVALGVYDIPVNQIVGIASENGDDCYISDFLPLPSAKTAFAEKWCNLYMEYLSDKGLAEPVQCYEYLGQFFISDGKMRVSIAKNHGAPTIKAHVIRLLPVETDDNRIRSYYEFVRTFEKTGVYQIAFTNPCDTNEFLKAIGYDPEHIWNDADRWGFFFHWYPFEKALKLAFNGYLNITTADAVQVLLKKHSYAELKQMQTWALAELMQESWLELYRISNPNFKIRCSVA